MTETMEVVQDVANYNGSACPFCLSLDVVVICESGQFDLYWCDCQNCHGRSPIKSSIQEAEASFKPDKTYYK